MQRHLLLVLTILATLLILAGLTVVVGAGRLAEPAAPLAGAGAPTVVSYQGQVIVAGSAYSGTGYFKFAVVDQSGMTTFWSNDGTSVSGGAPTTGVTLTVSAGLFNVLLGAPPMTALTADAFRSTESYLRVWFSSDGSTFILLSPDRRIAAVPYALQAEKAKSAANVVIVAKSGGDFTTISAALASITDASDTNRYLVKVMPGVYSEHVTMKPYVDIEGAGELTTRITYTGSASFDTGTVVGASNAELRFLTVANTGGDNWVTAIYNGSASPRLTHVTATASGGTYAYGVWNYTSSPAMTDVIATASGGTNSNFGVFNDTSSPTMTDVTATASGGTFNSGVANGASSPTMTDVTATASGGTNSYGVYNFLSSPAMTDVTATASGGTNSNYGVYNTDSSSPTMTDVTATASGGTGAYGVYNYNSSPTIQNSTIAASGGTNNYGIYNTAGLDLDTFTVKVSNSQITGSTSTIRNDSKYTTRVGASQLAGEAASAGGGPMTCAGVYDENYAFYASTCP
ncbi:MAG: hypothetical protein NT169_26470 [Chloroflexi bacterium]|nr:hypothetical protein [Chloroflexota bacterium]